MCLILKFSIFLAILHFDYSFNNIIRITICFLLNEMIMYIAIKIHSVEFCIIQQQTPPFPLKESRHVLLKTTHSKFRKKAETLNITTPEDKETPYINTKKYCNRQRWFRARMSGFHLCFPLRACDFAILTIPCLRFPIWKKENNKTAALYGCLEY